jgi:dTDP-4-amino-4,6-dideoxygalactose transaminase
MGIAFHHIEYDREDVRAVLEAIESNMMSPRGPKLEEFGKAWAGYVGKSYGWPVSSGTAAIHCALLALGVGKGYGVLVPSYTCSPTVFPVSYVGAEPIFVDCEPDTYCMNPEHMEELIERHGGRKKLAAVVTHLYGGAARKRCLDVCREKGVLLIEDACENAGGRYREPEVAHRYQGSLSDAGCFSFRGDKMFTSLGTGGALVTDSEHVLREVKYWSDLGLHNTSAMGRYRDLPCIGYNYEMSNVAAAFGLSQIRLLASNVEKRRKAASLWREALGEELAASGMEGSLFLVEDYPGHCYYQFPIRFELLKTVEELDGLGRRLLDNGVPLIPAFWPMHRQPMYRDMGVNDCPVSEYCAEHTFMFPCHGGLSPSDVEYMASVVVRQYREILSAGGRKAWM